MVPQMLNAELAQMNKSELIRRILKNNDSLDWPNKLVQ